MPAVRKLNSLTEYLMGEGVSVEKKVILEELKDMKSPYREAVWAHLISTTYRLEDIENQKALFDEEFPESQFSTNLLRWQYRRVRSCRDDGYIDSLVASRKLDSLAGCWEEETPSPLGLVAYRPNENIVIVDEQ